MKAMKALMLAVIVLALAVPAFAQQVDIRATPPAPQERPADFVTPRPYYEVTEPRENQWYPEGVRVPYDPAFIAPLSQEYETPTTRGRVGVAGWTSQNFPVGAPGTMYREQAGWLSFGFAFSWGAPPRAAAPRPASGPVFAPSR